MTKPEPETLDAVVIGGNIRGLVTCYVLDRLGYRAVLLERGRTIGGVDRSFVATDNTVFDFGLHVLDDMRSTLATRLFTKVAGGAVRRIELLRGIVLRGQVMKYAPAPADMPATLRAMLPEGPLVDQLGDDPPTRENLARYYGREFVDLIFDEVLPSFPTEQRHAAFGVHESELVTNIYPWFFPRAKRLSRSGDPSRAFHDRLRDGVPQHILYPKEGGFGGFVDGFLKSFDPRRIEVLASADDLRLDLEPGTHTVRSISAAGRRFVARHYFWSGGWAQLSKVLDIPCQDTATDLVALGSFRLDRPAHTRFHELLVGDPALRLNRVYFPAAFRGTDEALLQVEFAFPVAAPTGPADADGWRDRWLADLRSIGVLDASHRVESFDFRTFQMHFNAYGMEGQRLIDADPSLVRADSNLRPVVPSMANLNLNRYVPQTVEYVASILGRD